MEKKTPKFNIIEVFAVVLIVLLAVVVLWKVAGPIVKPENPSTSSSSADKTVDDDGVHITYVVRAENVAAELYDNVKEHIPSQLMASGILYDGWVVAVEKEPYLVLAADGKWVEDPDHVTLLFTVEADVPDGEVMTTLVGTQEIRIGRPGYNLKTEYMEFRETVIVDIHWENWAPPADLEAKKSKLPVEPVV